MGSKPDASLAPFVRICTCMLLYYRKNDSGDAVEILINLFTWKSPPEDPLNSFTSGHSKGLPVTHFQKSNSK
jgi:hypothetical protein